MSAVLIHCAHNDFRNRLKIILRTYTNCVKSCDDQQNIIAVPDGHHSSMALAENFISYWTCLVIRCWHVEQVADCSTRWAHKKKRNSAVRVMMTTENWIHPFY